AMQHLKWAGYDAVEISALQGLGAFGDPLGEHLHLDRWQEEAAEIKRLTEEFELPITAMEVGPLDEDRVLTAFDAAAEIGIPVVNIGPSGKSDRPEDLVECIERMAKLAETAEQAGVTLCVKAHVGASIHDTVTTLRAMEQIPSPAFGIDMDPSHVHRAGEIPKDALRQVISRVRHVHIRDCPGPGPAPGEPEFQSCGRGDIDLLGYCRVLADCQYDGPVNVEIIGASRYHLERCAVIAAENAGFLNACFKLCGAR
ncbi:MAG TPA: sugar phosphate isomerase/epimerase family protein, partial [Candidatus Hydrogenedentes bacterium]|nr:sugar phosphate isomerase/epimerase family protein [Candidatus Hydrogenedentota bacterium]